MLYLFNPFIKNFMSLMPSTEVIVTQKSFNSKSFSQYYSIQPSPYKRMYNYIILYIATYIIIYPTLFRIFQIVLRHGSTYRHSTIFVHQGYNSVIKITPNLCMHPFEHVKMLIPAYNIIMAAVIQLVTITNIVPENINSFRTCLL